jgi:hypothetical protein
MSCAFFRNLTATINSLADRWDIGSQLPRKKPLASASNGLDVAILGEVGAE